MPLTKQQIDDLSVMIIDDEPFMRKLLIRLLIDIGVSDIQEASDGADGLNQLARNPEKPNIIICDLDMPGINGIEFVRKLRAAKMPEFSDLPVLIVTGNAGSDKVEDAVNAGIHGYLVKPISRNMLESRMASALDSGPIDPTRMKR